MKKFMIKTLGCKANYSDGQLLEVGLQQKGFVSTRELSSADFVIVNSCTVTNEADVQSQRLVKEVHQKNPNAKIIYTGCAAEVNPESALKIKGVSGVIGNQDKTEAARLIEAWMIESNEKVDMAPQILGSVTGYEVLASRHPMDREWAMPESKLDEVLKLNEGSSTFRTRTFIKIQEGCDSFCTYCIIPYGRGPARSLPIETIVENINSLVERGVQEVILTGTNIGDYGVDWAKKLMIDDLLEAILTKTKLPRLRIGSLDPSEISDRMIALMEKYTAFCPHFHVSLQNTNAKILKLMKRKYTSVSVDECLIKLSFMKRRPFVGMDYITGFPGETDEDFEMSFQKLANLPWNRLHVFPYSERAGTPATKLSNAVHPSIRKQRAKRLQALSLERMTQFHSELRQKFEKDSHGASHGLLRGVLLESHIKGPDGTYHWVSGHTQDYQRVIFQKKQISDKRSYNEVVDVKIHQWVIDPASGDVSWMGSN